MINLKTIAHKDEIEREFPKQPKYFFLYKDFGICYVGIKDGEGYKY